MQIFKKRIRNIGKYIPSSWDGKLIHIGFSGDGNEEKLSKIGFKTLAEGESVLPSKIGPITKHNAEGDFIKRKDLPKETYIVELPRGPLTDRGGYTHSGVNYIEKLRYQRDFIPPMESYMTLSDNRGKKLILSEAIIYNPENLQKITHIINVFLECFGCCEIFDEKLESYYPQKIIKLNWELLPKGEFPRDERKEQIRPFLTKLTPAKRELVEKRFQFIETFKPEYVGVGVNGFGGYMAFWFPKKNFCLLECHETYNATYILGENRQQLSQLTKSDLLKNNLHEKRVIHTQSREVDIEKLLR